MKKQADPFICYLQETHFRAKDIQAEGEGIEKDSSCKQKWQESRGSFLCLILDKIDFKTSLTEDKEGHYIMIKGSIQEDDTILINFYAPNIGVPKYIRQILTDIKGRNWK